MGKKGDPDFGSGLKKGKEIPSHTFRKRGGGNVDQWEETEGGQQKGSTKKLQRGRSKRASSLTPVSGGRD